MPAGPAMVVMWLISSLAHRWEFPGVCVSSLSTAFWKEQNTLHKGQEVCVWALAVMGAHPPGSKVDGGKEER